MKVLLLNGSTRKNGCTYLALSETAKVLNSEGVETEIIQMDGGPVRDCIGCNGCAGKGQCVFGPAPELVEQDKEGLQTMRNLGRNMAWLLKCIQAGTQQGVTPPAAETDHWTNFNR